MNVTVDQLLAKIGQLTILNDAKDARIAELQAELAEAVKHDDPAAAGQRDD